MSETVIAIFASPFDNAPLALFAPGSTTSHIRSTLGLGKGGLKKRGDVRNVVIPDGEIPVGEYELVHYSDMRFVAEYKGETVAIRVKYPKSTIDSLYTELEARLAAHGTPNEPFEVKSLNSGGMDLLPTDTIDEVLANGSHISVVTFAQWVEKQMTLCKYAFLSVSQDDTTEGEADKVALVGYHNHNKIYIALASGYSKQRKFYKFLLLDRETLTKWSKDGLHEVSSHSGVTRTGTTFELRAYVLVENHIATAIRLSVRSGSSSRAEIKQISVSPNKSLEEAGTISVVQSGFQSLQEILKEKSSSEEIRVPARTAVNEADLAPLLAKDAAIVRPEKANFRNVDLPANHANANLLVEVTSIRSRQNYGPVQTFDLALRLTASAEVNVVEGRLEAFINGEWTAPKYSTFANDAANLIVAANSVSTPSLDAAFPIAKGLYDFTGRAPASFGNPARLRVTLKTFDGVEIVREVEYFSKDVSEEIPSQKSVVEKHKESTLLHYIHLDDPTAFYRNTCGIFELYERSRSERRLLVTSSSSNSWYVGRSNFAEALADAQKQRVASPELHKTLHANHPELAALDAEVVTSSLSCYDSPVDGFKTNISFVVSLKYKVAYALAVTLDTASSSVTEYFVVPEYIGASVADK